MEDFERLTALCLERLNALGLRENTLYKKRINWELKETKAQEKSGYFLNLVDQKIRYRVNQNNLMLTWLLGIVKDFDIDQGPKCSFGEFPDIDSDYISEVRDYLKNDWAPRVFGEDRVCNISNYTTFKIKSSLIDMARVYGAPRDEILALTTKIGLKDEDGNNMTWDKALEIHPDLKAYCEKYPDVADAASRLLNRNRGTGVHAGGLIISSVPIADFVPLIRRKDARPASAWVEGLSGQDLQPMGLIKFDLLVIANLKQLAAAKTFILDAETEKALKLTNIISSNLPFNICALPGLPAWSDTEKWRNDPAALEMADKADLKCIFQFDSDGIRKMVREGGVTRFEDLPAYSALYRPGCISEKMHERYIQRKRGKEKYEIHPLLEPILGKTYGVMIFQETVMQVLNVVGNIPLKDCYFLIKAISKKKIEAFAKYKEMFIKNGQTNLCWSEEDVADLWNQVEAFSGYGFNLSHSVAYSYVSMRLLYLKCHYPKQFYTAILSCEKETDKIKEYKMEAKVHQIDIERVNVNKSKVKFDIVDDKIYYGLSSIKGIGDAIAQRIVDHQPYSSFEDFLNRFGTESNVVKALISLRCFKDADTLTLYDFYETFKDKSRKLEIAKTRLENSLKKYDVEFHKLIDDNTVNMGDFDENFDENPFGDAKWKKFDVTEHMMVEKDELCNASDPGAFIRQVSYEVEDGVEINETLYYRKVFKPRAWNRLKKLNQLWQKRQITLEKWEKKQTELLPRLADHKLGEIDSDLIKELRDPVACEIKYYGFAWIHDLEKSPDYIGNMTLNQFKDDPDVSVTGVELKIVSVINKTSNKGNSYTQLKVEDVTGLTGLVNVWQDDWARWGSKMVANALVKMRVKAPSNGFTAYSFESYPKYLKHKTPKIEDDFRLVIMRPGASEIEKVLTQDEAIERMERSL